MKVATWNVNSIRVRIDRLLRFLERHSPDVVCLQETKVVDETFPRETLEGLGYHVETYGQKTYNGVALLSRHQLEDVVKGFPDGVEDPQCRAISATVQGIRLVNLYVPNGSRVGSEKFEYKLRWLQRLADWLESSTSPDTPLALLGDFNIAPDDRDVYAPDEWRGKVLFHPDEHKALEVLKIWGLTDAFRLHHEEGGHYSWWDFRGGMFWKGKGLRIDLILITRPLIERCSEVEIDAWERKGKQPSDHAPVLITLDGPPG